MKSNERIEIKTSAPSEFTDLAKRFGFTTAQLASLLVEDFCYADPECLWIIEQDRVRQDDGRD